MIWFYERSGTFVRFETRDVPDRPGEYELVRIDADGREIVERFDDAEALLQRQLQLERRLVAEGWQGPHGRLI